METHPEALPTNPLNIPAQIVPSNKRSVKSPKAVDAAPPTIQTLDNFLDRKFSPKDPLIDGLLYRRDIVALAGRRRHGKTTFIGNLALSLAYPKSNFLGYGISQPFRVLIFYLEDDAGELQIKLKKMSNDRSPGERIALYTRDDFYQAKMEINVTKKSFKKFIAAKCAAHRPDLIILDNLSQLIGADYNSSKLIHNLMQFIWELTRDFNTAVIVAAHPRKRGKKTDSLDLTVRLRDDSEGFFEEVMGSSHFVNSCGSLWGIERDMKTNRTDFLGGAQRFTGQQSIMTLEKGDDDWLYPLDDFEVNLPLALNTATRKKAWELLPDGLFSRTEAEKSVRSTMKSSSTFHEWFECCKRLGVIVSDDERYRKASRPPHPGNDRGG